MNLIYISYSTVGIVLYRTVFLHICMPSWNLTDTMLIFSFQWMYNLVDFLFCYDNCDVSRNCVYCSMFKELGCDFKTFFDNSVTGKTKLDFSHDQKWVNSNFFVISRPFSLSWKLCRTLIQTLLNTCMLNSRNNLYTFGEYIYFYFICNSPVVHFLL